MRLAPRRYPRSTEEEVTVLQRVNRERVVVLGWAPAILMQLAHPMVAAGVAEHSRFLDDPLARFRRLGRTIGVMQSLMFGDAEEAARAADKVNAIHRRVTGSLHSPTPAFPAGTPYQALDPDLLLWVFASLLYALPRTYELFVGPLTPKQRDRFCAEAARLGVMMRVPVEMLPTDAAGVDRYLERMLTDPVLAIGDTSRSLVGEILHPSWPRITYPLLWLASLPAVGLLPPALRRAYGLRWTKRHEQTLQIVGWICRHILPMAPRHCRWWPAAAKRSQQRRRAPAARSKIGHGPQAKAEWKARRTG